MLSRDTQLIRNQAAADETELLPLIAGNAHYQLAELPIFNLEQPFNVDTSGLVVPNNAVRPAASARKSDLSPVAKYLGIGVGVPLAAIGSLPVATHYLLGVYQFTKFIEEKFGRPWSRAIIGVLTGATAISCYLTNLSLNGTHVIDVTQKTFNSLGCRRADKGRVRQSRYSRFNHAASWSIGIPLILMTAAASSGLSYEGTKELLLLIANYFHPQGISSEWVDAITLTSFSLANVDFIQTLFTEGRHTIEGLLDLLPKGVNLVKYLGRLLKESILHLADLPDAARQLLHNFADWLNQPAIDAETARNKYFEVVVNLTKIAANTGKTTIVLCLVAVLPVMLSLIGATGAGAQFYYGGAECIINLIKDLCAVKTSTFRSIIHTILGDGRKAQEIAQYFGYPIAISAGVTSFFLNGKYLIIKAIAFEQQLYRMAAGAVYEAKYLAQRLYYSNSAVELEPYQGIFADLDWPTLNDKANILVKATITIPILLMITWQALASAGLTFVGMDELFPSLLWLSITVAIFDGLQAITTEGSHMFHAGDFIMIALKRLLAKIAGLCGYEMDTRLPLAEVNNEDERDLAEVITEGVQGLLAESTVRNSLYRNSTSVLFRSARAANQDDPEDEEQGLALQNTIGYYQSLN